MNFKVGDKIVHAREGLSTITGETSIAGNEYFVVHADKGSNENIYVLKTRTDNIIRAVMNKDEALAIIDYMKSVPAAFISNTKQRRDLFKKKLNSGDVKELSYLFRQNYLYKKHPEEVRLGPVDLDMLNYASNNFLDEFAITYNVPRPIVEDFVYQKFN